MNWDSLNPHTFSLSVIISIVAVLVTLLLVYLRYRLIARANTVLIVGLTDAGTTLMFSRLVTGKAVLTYASMKENKTHILEIDPGKRIRLIDYPGADRLRGQLMSKRLGKQKKLVRGVIYVVDSITFSKRVRDVAEFLYDVLFATEGKIPVLVACNKQDDEDNAKSSQAISSALEREIGLINASREAALEATDGDTKKRVLTATGKEFKWTDLPMEVEFHNCFAVDSPESVRKHPDQAELGVSMVKRWLVETI